MVGVALTLHLLFLAALVCSASLAIASSTSDEFVLPKSFLGTWVGGVDFSVFGPFSGDSYLFSISQAPNGDYLFENNIVYDELAHMGYQRFYVEGTGPTASSLWYCGKLTNFSNFDEVTGDDRLNGFKALKFPELGDTSVTFCLDTDNDAVRNVRDPFQATCTGCACANWTIAYDESTDTLLSQLSMSGSENHTNSKHMWVTLTRTGPAPVITDEDVASGHGEAFSCEFEDDGRDSVPVDRGDSPLHNKLMGHPPVSTAGATGGCPHMKRLNANKLTASTASGHPSNQNEELKKPSLSSSHDHCYVINKYSDFRLAWTLDSAKQLLHVTISAPPVSGGNINNTYVAVGFRPMSRVSSVSLTKQGTGRHMDFAMQGADIVAGSVGRGLRSLYAELYTGPPIPDESLQISATSVELVDGRVEVSFTRPLVGGYLFANYGNDGSIVSGSADIIWAVGIDSPSASHTSGGYDEQKHEVDENTSGCEYHSNTRGLRFIDWEDPTIAMVDVWQC